MAIIYYKTVPLLGIGMQRPFVMSCVSKETVYKIIICKLPYIYIMTIFNIILYIYNAIFALVSNDYLLLSPDMAPGNTKTHYHYY